MRRNPHMRSGTYSSVVTEPELVVDAANENGLGAKSKPVLRLATAIPFYVAIEFLVVAESALGAAFLYHALVVGTLQRYNIFAYTSASATIATLVLLISLGFHNFSSLRQQARHKFLWSGIGAVALAFSFFQTIFSWRSSESFIRAPHS